MADAGQLRDERTAAMGWPRALFGVLEVGAVIFLWRGIVASTDAFLDHRVPEGLLTLLAAVSWVAGAAGVLHNGRRMRRLALVSWTLNLLAPIAALVFASWDLNRVNPWFHGGQTYYFLPTAGALAALVWLMWSAPSKIATRNGG